MPIRDEASPAGNMMMSAWQPTPEELSAIAAGGSILLIIFGTAHPVVALGVSSVEPL